MQNNLRLIAFPVKKFIIRPTLCWYSSRPVVDTSKRFRIKKIPKDIWSEEKDPRYTGTEEVKGHWHFVERLFPKLRIPEPPKSVSSTGWKAPEEGVPNLPYFVGRTRNHMLPVYETRVSEDHMLVTNIRKIQGDIYVLEHDLKTYLEGKLGEKLESHVNEMACSINIRGSHVELIKEWLYEKGF